MCRPLPAGLLLASGLLSGCGLDLVCPHDPHSWYDYHNATYTLLQADFQGQNASFDFDPNGDPAMRRKGSYSLSSGDLSWSQNYKGAHYLDNQDVTGYGTIYDNGNLDLLVKVTTTDVLGSIWAELLRVERYRCEGTVSRYAFEPDWPVEHAPDSNAHTEYWATEIKSDTKVTMYGEYLSGNDKMVINRTCTEGKLREDDFDYAEGGYVGTTTMRYDGTGIGEWSQFGDIFGSTYDYHGTNEYFFDGSTQQDYDVYTKNTDELKHSWSLLYLYDGSATGDFVQYNNDGSVYRTCDVTITTSGSCTGACDNGSTLNC